MIPSWTKALAWLAMFRNSTSGANGFLAGLGIPIPDWLAYGPVAISRWPGSATAASAASFWRTATH